MFSKGARHAHKLAIVDLVVTKKPGDIVTKDMITSATRVSPEVWRSAMSPAIKTLRRDHGLVLSAVRGVGYSVAKTEDKSGIMGGMRRAAFRRVKAAKEVGDTVTMEELQVLPRDQQDTFIRQRGVTGLVYEMLATKRLEASTKVNNGERPRLPGK